MQVPFKKSLHGCRANFPDGLRPLRFLFLDALLPLGVGGSEGGAVFGFRFCTLFFIVPETTLVSSRTLSFLLSIDGILLVRFQHHVDPAIRNPFLLFQFTHVGLQSFAVCVSDICFFSPSFSTSDNLVSISFDEFQGRTIPIRFLS